MDQEFDKVENKISLVEVNTSAAREHVGEIERMICVIKESAWVFLQHSHTHIYHARWLSTLSTS